MNTVIEKQNLLVKDLDGRWYSIPSQREEEFKALKEAIILADWCSGEWYDANDEFNNIFGQYLKDE